MNKDPFANLNDAQRFAAATDGDVLVLSPAGSGKTATVQAAIVRIITEGWSPEGILALTFTNKAADELLARVAKAIPGRNLARRIRTGTFHGFCSRTIRDYPETLGLTGAFTIYDDDDRNDVGRRVAEHMGEKIGNYGFDAVRRKVNKASPQRAATLDALYSEALVAANATDYDGLEAGMLRVLTHSKGARAEMAGLHHIIVDEYQDTSPRQAQIVDILRSLAPAASVMRVGDPAQSIYGFRGADAANIQALARAPGVQVATLHTNYRSGRNIVKAGNLLARGAGSPLDNVVAGRDTDGAVNIHEHTDAAAAGAWIATMIQTRMANLGATPGEHMILGRTWGDLAETAAALTAAGVPAEIARNADDAWTTMPMRHLISAMRCRLNERDALAFRRLAAWPTEAVTSAEILRHESEMVGEWTLVRHLRHVQRVQSLGVESDPTTTPAAEWAAAFAAASRLQDELTAAKLTSNFASADDAHATLAEWSSAREAAGRPRAVPDFLHWYACRHVLEARPTEHSRETGPVRLMTVHAAKGLQSRYVHVVGLEAGNWPRADLDDKEAGEERRVFYVAATRAEDALALHTCQSRRAAFTGKLTPCRASPLLLPLAVAFQ